MRSVLSALLLCISVTLHAQQMLIEPSDMTYVREFISPFPVDNGRFGSPEISGNILMVGEVQRDNFTGAVHVFEYDRLRDSLTFRQTLTAADAGAGKAFGSDVSIYDSTAIIGSFYWDEPEQPSDQNCGAVYIFRYHADSSKWIQCGDAITSQPVLNGDMFGVSVDIEGDTVLIGSMGNDDVLSNSGCFQIFELDKDSLLPGDKYYAPPEHRDAGDNFGCDFGVEGNMLVVGAWQDNETGQPSNNTAGAAYIYEKDGGTYQFIQRISAYDPKANACFGESVTMDGDIIFVGAYRDSVNNYPQGSVYIFQKDESQTWIPCGKFTGNNSTAWDDFGVRMSADENLIVIGSWLTDRGYSNNGSCYIYTWEEQEPLHDDHHTDPGIRIFPNPTRDLLHIDTEDVKSIEIYNACGQKIMETHDRSIDLEHVQNGVYILRIITGTHTVVARKIIKF